MCQSAAKPLMRRLTLGGISGISRRWISSGIDDIISDNIGISVINRAIHIDNADGNMLVEVFNLSGKSVYRGHGNIVDGLSTGIYIIKIADKSMKIKI